MKIPNKMNPSLVCSKDETRYVITNVLAHEGMIVATDGRRIMVALSEDSDWEDSRKTAIISCDAVKTAVAKRRGKLFQNEIQITDTGVVIRHDLKRETAHLDPCGGNFPAFSGAIPDDKDCTQRLTINAKLLAGLAAAMGDDAITLHFNPSKFTDDGYLGAILATNKSAEVVGAVMPVRGLTCMPSVNKALSRVRETKNEPIHVGKGEA